MTLKDDLNKDIAGLPNRKDRIVVRILIIAVISLSSVVSILWYNGRDKDSKNDGTSEERIRNLRMLYNKKDSALSDCKESQLKVMAESLKKETESLNREREINRQSLLSNKRQDSILNIINRSKNR